MNRRGSKLLRSAVALLLVCVICLPLQALAFTDVDSGRWYADAISACEEKGLYLSVPLNGLYEPQKSVDRAMFMVMLVNLAGGQAGADTKPCTFSDVRIDNWFYKAVCWATANGIIDGYDDNTFRPDRSITRQEMIAIMYRVAKYLGKSTAVVSDYRFKQVQKLEWIDAWSADYINWSLSAGVITGYDDGRVLPGGTATRAEAAQIVCNFMRWMDCAHAASHLDSGSVQPGNCVTDGYTGDTVCNVCGAVVSAGTYTAASGAHVSNGVYGCDSAHTDAGHAEYTTCAVCGAVYYTGSYVKKAGCLDCYDVAAIVSDTYSGNYTRSYAEDNDYSDAVKEAWVAYEGYYSPTDYLIWVNRAYQHVNIFRWESGRWVLDRSFLCATGKDSTPTPLGTFRLFRHQTGWFDSGYTAYNICWFLESGYAFHSVLYYPDGSNDIMDGSLGFPASHGCIRMNRDEVRWIYTEVPLNTTVVIY